jgi:glycogen debranching enzyme
MLAHRYYVQTDDSNFVKSIEKNVMAAAKWIDDYADPDNDGISSLLLRAAAS